MLRASASGIGKVRHSGRGAGNGSSGGGGGSASTVSLLMHMEGTENTATYTDSSTYAANPTLGGGYNPLIESSAPAFGKFGSSSLEFFGIGTGWLSSANADKWDFGAGDFTVEWWVYPNFDGNVATLYQFMGKRAALANYSPFAFYYNGNGRILAYLSFDGSTWAGNLTTAAQSFTTWKHQAIVREGTTFSVYGGGDRLATATVPSGALMTNTAPVTIGSTAAVDPANNSYVGWLDELRVTKGAALYSGATYTVPTAAFPNP